jgi:hypothetical protein
MFTRGYTTGIPYFKAPNQFHTSPAPGSTDVLREQKRHLLLVRRVEVDGTFREAPFLENHEKVFESLRLYPSMHHSISYFGDLQKAYPSIHQA